MHSKRRSFPLRLCWRHWALGAVLAAFLAPAMAADKHDLEAQVEALKRRIEQLEKERDQRAEARQSSTQDAELAEVRRPSRHPRHRSGTAQKW